MRTVQSTRCVCCERWLRRHVLGALVAVFSLGFVCAGQAVLVTSSGGTVTNFYDNFEGVGPFTETDDADPNNGAAPGSWTILEDTPVGTNIQVLTMSLFPSPGAIEGSNYLRIRQPNTAATRARAQFPSELSLGLLRADWMMYVPADGLSFPATISFFPASGDSIDSQSIVSINTPVGGNSNVNYRTTSSTWVPLSSVANGGIVPYLANTWQQWTLEVDLDTDTFRVGVESAFSTWLPNRNIGNVGALRFSPGAQGRSYYVDALPVVIPEPATGALLGLAVLLRRLRRRD